jgi:hypothetical protein
MAKVEKNIAMRGMAGKIGDLVFRQMRDGSTRVSAAPSFKGRKFSKRQKGHQSRFKEAAAYARDAAKSQPIYAELAKEPPRTPIILRSPIGSTRLSFIISRAKLDEFGLRRATM